MIAHVLRNAGVDTQIIYGFSRFEPTELMQVLEKFVNERTVFIGFSTTFFFPIPRRHERILKQAGVLSKITQLNVEKCLLEIIRSIRHRWPNLKIVSGGPQNFFLESFHKLVDHIFVGYSEKSILDYLKSIGIPVKEFSFDFSTENIKYLTSDCVIPGETLTIEISRGCKFNCAFCSFPLRGTKNPQIRTYESLRAHFIDNYDKYGVTKYMVVDDTFNDSNEKLRLFLKVSESLPFKLQYAAFIRLDMLMSHKDQIGYLRDSGLIGVYFGIESLNRKVGPYIGKKTDGEWVLDSLFKFKSEFSNDLNITTSFIVGLPEDDEATVYKWAEVIKDKNFPADNIVVHPLHIAKYGAGTSLDYISKFDADHEGHGYVVEKQEGLGPDVVQQWKNKKTGMTFLRATEIADSINRDIYSSHKNYSNFFHLLIMGYGFSAKEAKGFYMNEYNSIKKILELTDLQFSKYKAALLNYSFKAQDRKRDPLPPRFRLNI